MYAHKNKPWPASGVCEGEGVLCAAIARPLAHAQLRLFRCAVTDNRIEGERRVRCVPRAYCCLLDVYNEKYVLSENVEE